MGGGALRLSMELVVDQSSVALVVQILISDEDGDPPELVQAPTASV